MAYRDMPDCTVPPNDQRCEAMTLFWHPAGLKISYDRDAFHEWLTVEDLNPEQKIEFGMTSMELLRLGFKCIWAAISP